MHEDAYALYELPTASGVGTNYSHFNQYKELEAGRVDGVDVSSLHRQARVDALPPPRTSADVRARLSDTSDAAYPIFRGMTLTSIVLDGVTGALDVWCCGSSPASGASPAYRWNVLKFFR